MREAVEHPPAANSADFRTERTNSKMEYCSTRNSAARVQSAQAIAQGISAEGGLFVPCEFPQIDYQMLCELEQDDYATRAEKLMRLFLTDFSGNEVRDCVRGAYTDEKFEPSPAPVVLLNRSTYVLELWHGPTCAFKDMALQILPHLMTRAARKTCDGKTVVILVATSGDTGKAALEGFRDVPNTKIIVFYPEDGVSPMQKLQMATQEGENVSVCAIHGNFDDAQTGVKEIFTNSTVKQLLASHNMQFSSANSINWGRLLPQIVYYFSAYCDAMNSGEMDYNGEKINFVVPTGNFGNILAAHYARKMGLPINKLICASNANNVLTDFIRTGVYDCNRPFYTTQSPSMDILVSSNLERLLFDLTGGDARRVGAWMENLKTVGSYEVDDAVKQQISELFYGNWCSDVDAQATIRQLFESEGYLCDTHTAVAAGVYEKYVRETGDTTPTVIVSTASPYKFADAVLQAVTEEKHEIDDFAKVDMLAAVTGAPVPEPIASLRGKQVRFTQSCEVPQMADAVLSMLNIR